MVAKVISGKTIRGVLSYNENKVKAGVAHCLMANQFGCEPTELNFHTKLNRFDKLMAHNAKTKTNAIHISLNFDVSENLKPETLCSIAATYMDKIGFGNQPYLVYQHHDAAHPHIHIVTTNIQEQGKRIDLHNIGRNQSETARKEIEKQFNLVRAESKKKRQDIMNPIQVERAIYGRSETKRSITNAVHMALSYTFTSLPEFNAILRQFKVTADRGKEGTQMHAKKGLAYSLLDKNGNKIGIPIKASAIYGKPTLANLEKQFAINEKWRLPHKERVKSCIDNCFTSAVVTSQTEFSSALQKQGIYVLLRHSLDGRVYGITFVDNKTKVVFNGSDLGKPYSAKALLEKISDTPYAGSSGSTASTTETEGSGKTIEMNLGIGTIVDDLISAKQHDFTSPDAAMKRRKRKKKKNRSH